MVKIQVPVTNKRDLDELCLWENKIQCNISIAKIMYLHRFDILKRKRILNVIRRKLDINMIGQDLEKDAIQASIKDL